MPRTKRATTAAVPVQSKPATGTKPVRKSRVTKADSTPLAPGYVAELQADLTKNLDLQPISQPASKTSAAPAPLYNTQHFLPAPVVDPFQTKVAALLAWAHEAVAGGADFVAEAITSGTIKTILNAKTPRQPGQKRGRHHDLDDATKQGMIADRNAGMPYVAIDLKHGFEDAREHKGDVSWHVCKAARSAGIAVR